MQGREEVVEHGQIIQSRRSDPALFTSRRRPAAERDQEAISAGRDRYEFFMTMLDRRLSESAYIAGEQFSMGEVPRPGVVVTAYSVQ